MAERILYNDEQGHLCMIIPFAESGLTTMETALKDVPTGLPFRIVDEADLPQDGSPFETWYVDNADLTDGVGA